MQRQRRSQGRERAATLMSSPATLDACCSTYARRVADADATPRSVLTVVMPVTRPDPRFFGEALESILEQSSPCWRLIIVTESGELEEIQRGVAALSDDPRIAVVPNTGRRLAGAINTGNRLAESEFVALLLADDRWHPSAVAVLSEHIAHVPDVDFFHSGRQIIDEDGAPISSVHPAKSLVTLADFATGAPVKHLLCWRRSKAVEAGGLDERSRSVGPDDLDFPWTMAEHGALFGAVGECLYLYRDHRSGERL